ncbi:MAG TPA: metallophosphoesterase [Polyangiales bacterium]|nr:metallophosphoesterase [Polyangiales bacterium]
MNTFALAALGSYLTVMLVTWRERGRFFAMFSGVALGIFTLVVITMQAQLFGVFERGREYLVFATYLHFLLLVWPRLRPWPVRLLVNYPASFFFAGTLLAWPLGIAVALGSLRAYWLLVPYGFSLLGLLESLWTPETVRDVVLDGQDAGGLRRYPLGKAKAGPVLQIVQITDPHIGTFMSIKRLRGICERAVARNPDMICLTGDFLTIESNREQYALDEALAPLAAARGKVYACLGNHDHEALHHVKRALAAHGVRLLVDEAIEVDTPIGRVQLLGFDFHFRERENIMSEVCARYPRPKGMLRIVLLHDPGAFRRLAPGEGDLVLAGHTHGGQVGLVSFGLPWTFVSAVTSIPDHGMWARGHDRLYVHRGTGHYGFPLRIGVPAEQSLLRVQRPSS